MQSLNYIFKINLTAQYKLRQSEATPKKMAAYAFNIFQQNNDLSA